MLDLEVKQRRILIFRMFLGCVMLFFNNSFITRLHIFVLDADLDLNKSVLHNAPDQEEKFALT